MKKNVGTIDKIVRLLLALVFIGLFFSHTVTGAVGVVLLVLAGMLILTSLISACPLYWPFGIHTNKK